MAIRNKIIGPGDFVIMKKSDGWMSPPAKGLVKNFMGENKSILRVEWYEHNQLHSETPISFYHDIGFLELDSNPGKNTDPNAAFLKRITGRRS